MSGKEIFVLILCFGGGIFTIAASIFNWDFFFEDRKAYIFVKIFGRQGARIFYSLLGLALFYVGYKIITT
jgi:small neutral amino acid transporter SnatA (MarC family)